MRFHQTPSFQQSEGHGQPIKTLLIHTKQELLYRGTQNQQPNLKMGKREAAQMAQ